MMNLVNGLLGVHNCSLRVVGLLVLVSFWSSGCASQPPFWRRVPKADAYKSLAARQPATSAGGSEALNALPELTVADYEAAGDRYHQQGNLTMAFVQYDKALRLDPSQKRIDYKKGRLYLHKGLLTDAMHIFRQLVKRQPNYALGYEGLGQALLRSGDLVKAEMSCARAVELDPSRWLPHNCLGVVYDRNQRFVDAIQAYQAAIALEPQQSLLYNNLGMSYYIQKDYVNAEEAFRQALSLNGTDNKVYNNIGLVLSKQGRDQEALDYFTKGSNRSKAHNNLGVVYLADGKPQKAIQAFETAITLSPAYYEKANQNLTLARRAMATPRLQLHPVGGELQGDR